MAHPSPEHVGPPAVRLSAFQLWVHGRQFPDAHDRYDGNSLHVTVHCGQTGASVWAIGAILDSAGLGRFRDELQRLYETLSGEAVLESYEPNVRVRVAVSDGTVPAIAAESCAVPSIRRLVSRSLGRDQVIY